MGLFFFLSDSCYGGQFKELLPVTNDFHWIDNIPPHANDCKLTLPSNCDFKFLSSTDACILGTEDDCKHNVKGKKKIVTFLSIFVMSCKLQILTFQVFGEELCYSFALSSNPF